MGRQIGCHAIRIRDLPIALDDWVCDQRRHDPGNQYEENDAESFKLALGFFRKQLLHPDGSHLHEHNIAAAEEKHADQQVPIKDRCRVNFPWTAEEAQDTHTYNAENDRDR